MDDRYLTVSALNKYIKNKIDHDTELQTIYIKGEVSNFRPSRAGHLYFTLKDKEACIAAIMFAGNARNLAFEIKDGQNVLIQATVSVYVASGQYQIIVKSIEPDGLGALYLKFQELKKKLSGEGLFNDVHKKELPRYPSKIAVLTAYPSAAYSDIFRTLKDRYPVARVIYFPIPVQGVDAYKTIINTLEKVDKLKFSLIILARGGGSLEDLWNFNEEELARCIYNCQTPIISGVGHEIDVTICDYVADYRAATPTAAATAAVPDLKQMKIDIKDNELKLLNLQTKLIETKRNEINALKNFYLFKNPEKIYESDINNLSNFSLRIEQSINNITSNEYNRFKNKKMQFVHDINSFVKIEKNIVSNYANSLNKAQKSYYTNENIHFDNLKTKLVAIGIDKTLQRGYSIVFRKQKVIDSVHDVKSGDQVTIKFKDGHVKAIIK